MRSSDLVVEVETIFFDGRAWLARPAPSRRCAHLIAWTCEHRQRAVYGGGLVVEVQAVVEVDSESG